MGDPQSWNEYTYVRNNPLRYVDPSGETASVTETCSSVNNQMVCTVNITASITIYAVPGSGITQDQLKSAASTIQSSIRAVWGSGSFQQNGVTFNVSVQATVSVAEPDAAMNSKTQNVIELPKWSYWKHLHGPHWGNLYFSGCDRGTWDFDDIMAGNTVTHEFTHLLGVDDKLGRVLSNSSSVDGGWFTKAHAGAQDYQWRRKNLDMAK